MKSEEKVYTIQQLEELGYPVKLLREIARSENFPNCGFKSGRRAFFYLPELKKELRRRTICE